MSSEKAKAVIVYIAARSCLEESLSLLHENFNNKYDYPVVVFTFGKIYSKRFIDSVHKHINPEIKFIELPKPQVPSSIKEEELFYNRTEIPYVKKSFPKARIGYLHMIHWVASEMMLHPEVQKYDYALKMDDDTFIIGEIQRDFLKEMQDKRYVFAPFRVKKYSSINMHQTQVGFMELLRNFLKNNSIVPKSTALDTNGNWDRMGSYDPTVFDVRMFRTKEWKMWWDTIYQSGGIYKYRWGDCEIHALYVRMFYPDSAWHNFDFYNKGKCKHGGYGPVYRRAKIQKIINFVKRVYRKLSLMAVKQRLQSNVKEGNLLWRLLVFPGRFSRYKFKLILGYFELYLLTRSLKSKLLQKHLKKNEVTIIITSAGRKEYLQKTIESLKKYFQYDDKKTKWFIIDDYPESKETRDYIESLKGFDLKLFNDKNKGLGYSLNRIYSEVESEFVFHCEDDWEFLRPIPIMQMITLLRQDSTLGQILTYRKPINEHEYAGAQEKTKGYAEYNRIFAFNPYLTKMEMFLRFFPFALYFTSYEYAFKVRKEGYKSGIIGYNEAPYVRHLGAHQLAKIK